MNIGHDHQDINEDASNDGDRAAELFRFKGDEAQHIEAALKKLGQHVHDARKRALRESREVFAKRIGCSPVTLDRIERGDPGVSIGIVMKALEAMRVLDAAVAATSPNLLITARQVLAASDNAPPGFRD
ncbi:MAG: helix-turn-helix transcriptional regulator [Polaromonas sp.]|nr:helix-turn-helix transcriptional regulator [Polaromonas sp.]